ncbi:MAG: helix-turn-helix transcriptional regulator [Myxococcales bacterium]
MSAAVEVVMPYSEDRRSPLRRAALGARVVAEPSARRDIDRIMVAASGSLGNPSGAEVISRVRAGSEGVPFVVVASDQRPEEVARLQSFAVASTPTEPAFVAADGEVVGRIIRAHRAGAEKALIATALVTGEELWVWSCEPKLYRCRLAALPPLGELPRSALGSFVVSKSGSRLHWREGVVDLTLDAIRAVVEPSVRIEQERRYRRDAKRYAKAIRLLREKHGLTQSQIPEVSARAIRRLEQGERIPHHATLDKLARAHGMTLAAYMRELAALSARA